MMSATSKIPQTRVSRIAGPSKLPSRILRPSFTNKTQPAIPNFVNSAKLIEKKKELATQVIHTEKSDSDSNLNTKSSRLQDLHAEDGRLNENHESLQNNNLPPVDCNGNKSEFSDKKFSPKGTDNQETKCNKNSRIKTMTSTNLTKKFLDYDNTVNVPESVKTQSSKATDNTDQPKLGLSASPNRNSTTSSPSFRSMKPGYFLQKVNAIKSSHQRAAADKAQTTTPGSKMTLPSKAMSYLNQGGPTTKGRFGFKSEEGTSSTGDVVSSTTSVLRPVAPPAKSRLAQKITGPQTAQESSGSLLSKKGSYVSRAEKRKKYLEAKNGPKSDSQGGKLEKESLTLPVTYQDPKPEVKTSIMPVQTSGIESSFRPSLRKPGQRNARIARPVTRPKKTPSPITPMPFQISNHTNQSHKPVALRVSSSPDDHSATVVVAIEKDVKAPASAQEGSRSKPEAPGEPAEPVLSSAKTSVTSPPHLNGGDRNDDPKKDPSSPRIEQPLWGWRLEKPCRSESDAGYSQKDHGGQVKRQHSYSVGDVLSKRVDGIDGRELEHQRFCSYLARKDVITYGQYRLQTEGNYAIEHRFGVTEGRQIRSSMNSDTDVSFDKRQTTPSPECNNENASDSSADTVIPNTRSPQPTDVSDQNDKPTRDDPKMTNTEKTTNVEEPISVGGSETPSNIASDDVFHEKLTLEADEIQSTPTSYSFTSASVDALFMTSALSPPPSSVTSGTPSTNSNSKAKKRRTDSVLMSPLLPGGEIENHSNEEVADLCADNQVLEREILFDEEPAKQDLDRINSINSLDDSVNEESLIELLDLPSLHESALMTDYNSVLEDELSSDAQSDDDEDTQGERLSPIAHAMASGPPSGSPSTRTNVINKLLNKGLNGIVRSDEDLTSSLSGSDKSDTPDILPLTNGYHCDEDTETIKYPNANKKLDFRVNSSEQDQHRPHDVQIDEILQEYRIMKMSLAEVYRILEKEEEKKEKQAEETKRLQVKNQKLSQTVASLTKELAMLKMSTAQQSTENKETQVEVKRTDVSTYMDSATPEQDGAENWLQENGAQTPASPRWYHTEVSNKVQSNIEEASEEIKYLKDLRGDFDRRINDAEQRLHSALKLMHR